MKYNYTLLISGIDRTHLLQANSLRIGKAEGQRHTASFVLVDKSASPYYPIPGEHVLIKEDGERIFAGQIEEPEEEVWAGPDQALETRVSCTDYTRLLDHYWVVGAWQQTTAADILADIFTPNSPYCDICGRTDPDGVVIPSEGISYTAGEPGVSIENYAVQNRSVYDVISELAQLSEYEWYLDYDKVLHFGPKDQRAAPIQIGDSTRNFRKLSVKKPLDEYANEVLMLGAVCETSPQFAEYHGDGETRVFQPYGKDTDVKYNILDVAPNDDYPTGCQIVDTSLPEGDPNRHQDVIAAIQGSVEGADFYFNSGSMDLTRGEGKPPLTATQLVRLRYTGEYPIWSYRTNMDAIAERAAVEGGGALYQHMEQDGTVDDPRLADRKAEAILTAKSVVPRVVTLETDVQVEPNCRDLSPGQVIQIQLSRYRLGKRDNPSLPDGFRISRIDIEDVAGQYLRYTIECVGSEKTNWVDAFRKLAQPEKVVKRAGDATVHMIRRVTDQLQMTDTTTFSQSDAIPWVGKARIGFCECVRGVEKVQVFVMPELCAEVYIAR